MDLHPLWIAGRFLTRLPFPEPPAVAPAQLGQAVAWYPLIGLVLGLLIALAATGASWLGPRLDPGLGAALVLVLWVWSTGALHLDGLADSADAWVGGLASRTRTLEILKDPHSGPAAIVAVVLVLLVKWAALAALIAGGSAWLLLLVPLLARALLPLLMLTTPYARERGIASEQVAHLPRRASWMVTLGAAVGACLIGGWIGALLVATALLVFWLGRQAMLRRLGGFTGDTTGALLELTEMLLVALLSAL